MDINITRKGQSTPLANSIVEYVTQMMALCGIEALEVKHHRMGMMDGVVTQMTPFARCPVELVDAAAAVKNALGELLSAAGVASVQVTLSESERNNCISSWSEYSGGVSNELPEGSAS